MGKQELHGIIVPEIQLSGTIQATVQLTGKLVTVDETEYATEQDIIDIFKGE